MDDSNIAQKLQTTMCSCCCWCCLVAGFLWSGLYLHSAMESLALLHHHQFWQIMLTPPPWWWHWAGRVPSWRHEGQQSNHSDIVGESVAAIVLELFVTPWKHHIHNATLPPNRRSRMFWSVRHRYKFYTFYGWHARKNEFQDTTEFASKFASLYYSRIGIT